MIDNERFKKVVIYLKQNRYIRNQQDFTERVGSDKSTVSQIINNKLEIPNILFGKIGRAFPFINIDWLMTGKGAMLNNTPNEPNQPKISYTKGVPYYNVDFIGGFDLILNDQTVNPEYLIDFKKYNEATCWCNVTGHSMEPEITHGDIIALKKIDDISFIPFGEVYAIVTTNDMRTIKRIGPASDPNCYSLIPTNKSPEYGVQELPKNMIRHIFHVLGCMKRL